MRVKICGLTRPDDVRDAARAGASYLGFVFFPPSPRSVTLDQGRRLMEAVPKNISKVALLVDPDDALIRQLAALPVDTLQLHGAETPERLGKIRAMTGLRLMKAIGIRDQVDLAEIDRFADVADQILVDAKPPKDATRPGGNAVSFDWSLIEGRTWPRPWLLAGGLTAGNVAEAVRRTGATQLDVSSGVESAPGIKDGALVSAFIRNATDAAQQATFDATL